VFEILRGYVELSQPATSRDIRTLLKVASSEAATGELQLLVDSYDTEVLAKRVSVLDILEKYSSDVKLPLATYLRMLPPMRVRQYSVSSSPLWNAEHVTLTISVLESPALSENSKTFLGVASNYLSQLRPGDKVQMSIRLSTVGFHPPEDPSVPVVMFCAGSGLAPMRGFIQERAMQKKSGREVGIILLFFGCRSRDVDYLYAETDLEEWVKLGFLDIRPTFSRASQDSNGCKYVQDRIWHDKDDVVKAYHENAKVRPSYRMPY
jgi:cytochrome P450/NADPH-cytochrome P450 reductase